MARAAARVAGAQGVPDTSDTPEAWRDRLASLRRRREATARRQPALREQRAGLALAAHEGDAAAAGRLTELAAEAADLASVLDELAAAMAAAEAGLAAAEATAVESERAARAARREALLAERAAAAERAESLIAELGSTLAGMRIQAEEIVALTAGRDRAETLRPLKTDQRLLEAMAHAGFTWRDRQTRGVAMAKGGFAAAEIAAQAAYAGQPVR